MEGLTHWDVNSSVPSRSEWKGPQKAGMLDHEERRVRKGEAGSVARLH